MVFNPWTFATQSKPSIRTDDHRLVGYLLDETFPLRLANVEVEWRHQRRKREEEEQRGQRRRVQRRQLHGGRQQRDWEENTREMRDGQGTVCGTMRGLR